MPEIVQNKKIFSLFEVANSIRNTLEKRYTSAFWVKAEMIRLNYYPHSGHCYPDLAEKSEGKIIAQIRSTLWRNDFFRINHEFQRISKEPLKDGIKILFLAKVAFDPSYGISLHMLDIDPSFTLGDLEKEKQETIAKLRAEKLFDKNKLLPLPLLPQRIAVISVETSKGFADFRKVIDNNEWGYRYFYFLFPALLQGDQAVGSILGQLNRIKKIKQHFDIVAIIRGGGGDVGLSCYNHLELSTAIANFPLPVITGIGHATNETIVEMVAFQNAITPTKMAEWLLQKFHNFSVPVNQAEEIMVEKAIAILDNEKLALRNQIKYFNSVTRNRMVIHKSMLQKQSMLCMQHARFFNTGSLRDLSEYQNSLKKTILLLFQTEKSQLNNMEKNAINMSPEKVLKRGYSITLINGKSIKSCDTLKPGDPIQTVLSEGSILSQIISTKKAGNHE